MFTRARRYMKRVKSTRFYERWMYRLHPDMMIDHVEYLEARVKTLEAQEKTRHPYPIMLDDETYQELLAKIFKK